MTVTTDPDVPQPEPEAPEVPAEPSPEPEPTVDLAEGMAAAMDEALREAAPEPEPEGDPPPEGEPAAAEAQPEGEEPAKPEGDPETPKPEGENAAPSAEDEATSLGVKNDKARERFVELRKAADELKALKESVPDLEDKATQYDQMLGHITSTGATPEQYQSALAYLNIVNKGTPEQLAQMRETLQGEIDWIDGKIGRGGDPLKAHDDLREAVETGDVTAEYAREIASQRNLKAAQQQHVTQQTQAQQQAEEAQKQAVQASREQLNALGQRLQASDPQYAAKVEKAMQAFQARLPNIHPSQWATEFLLDYQSVQVEAPSKPPISSVPLRSQGAGAMGKVPTSMEEAMEMGLQAHAQGRG